MLFRKENINLKVKNLNLKVFEQDKKTETIKNIIKHLERKRKSVTDLVKEKYDHLLKGKKMI